MAMVSSQERSDEEYDGGDLGEPPIFCRGRTNSVYSSKRSPFPASFGVLPGARNVAQRIVQVSLSASGPGVEQVPMHGPT